MKKVFLMVLPFMALSFLTNCNTTKTYTITYENLLGAKTDNPTTYTANDAFTFNNPTDRGYAFTGWHKDSVSGETITEITKGTTGDLTLYASWDSTPTTYTITYHNIEHATHDNPTSYTVETSTITLNPATKDGFKFGGWYKDENFSQEIPSIPKGSTGNLDIYAKFMQIYTITYHNVEDAKHNNPTSYTVETDTITLNPAIKDGFKFGGWYKDKNFSQEISSIPKGSTGNLDIYAKFLELYTITYECLEGSTTDNPTSYTSEDAFVLNDPTDHGYAFTGWHKDSVSGETITEITEGTTGDLILYASWSTTPTTYTIIYHLDGGTVVGDNPTEYDVTKTISLISPTQGNFVFSGWYLAEHEHEPLGGDGWEPGQIVGNLDLYADWHNDYLKLSDLPWPDIAKISASENASKCFDIGDTKKVTVNKQEHEVRLIDYNHDVLADGSNKTAGITFEFTTYISDQDGYSLAVPWNVKFAETSNAQDYPNSNLRKAIDGGGSGDLMWYEKEEATKSDTYNISALQMLPGELVKELKTVKKETAVSYQYKVTTYDTKLFPLSYHETTEKNDSMAVNEGETYQFYKGAGDIDAHRIKHQVKWHEGAVTNWTNITDIKFKDPKLQTWNYAGFNSSYKDEYGGFGWLRSPLTNASSSAWQVGVGGAYLKYSVYQYAIAVAPAFCI